MEQEKRWSHLSTHLTDSIFQYEDSNFEYITTHWGPIQPKEELLVWSPEKCSLWETIATTNFVRREWWEFLTRDLTERYSTSVVFPKLEIPSHNSWQSWWKQVRSSEPEQQRWSAWLLQLFVRAHPNLHIWVGFNQQNTFSLPLLLEESYTIHEEHSTFIQNLIQELTGCQEKVLPISVTKLTWRIYIGPLPDCTERPSFYKEGWMMSGLGLLCKVQQRAEAHAWADLFLHEPSMQRLHEIPHQNIPLHSWWFGFIWKRWMCRRIPVRDRLRFTFAGGMVKSAYYLRDAADVDFLVCDHKEELSDRYHPELGSEKLRFFNDFGRTYYACERYFFPLKPEWYAAQKKYKITVPMEEEENSETRYGSELIPKFSASGLKASRYFPILQWLWDRCCSKTDNIPLTSLDDLMFHPGFGFFRGGIHYVPLEWEFQRDHLKSLDLGRISKKQLKDISTYTQMYQCDPNDIGFENLQMPNLTWKWNIYHGNLMTNPVTNDPVGLEVRIRRAPLMVHKIFETWIRESQFKLFKYTNYLWRIEICSNGVIVHHRNDHLQQTIGMEQLIMRQVLVSSLPPTIEWNEQEVPATWWWVITSRGEIHVQLWIHPWNLGGGIPVLVRNQEWIAAGTGRVTYHDNNTAKWSFSILRTEEALNEWGIPEHESEIGRFNLSKILTCVKYMFQTQKIYDVQQKRTWVVQYEPEQITPDWERIPWIQQQRAYWENNPWIERWISASVPKCLTLQLKHGIHYNENPTSQWKIWIRPKLR